MATYRKELGIGLFLDIETNPGAGNVNGNYTPTNVKVYLRTTSGYLTANATKYGTLYIDGSPYDFSVVIGSLGKYSSRLLYENNKNVPHNDDGTKKLYVSCSFGIEITYNNVKLTTVSVDGSEDLKTIPRASTPSVSGTLQLGSEITIKTNRASDSFIHNIYVSWGSQINNERIATGISTSKKWTIPKDYANYIPNGDSGTLFITCETYKKTDDVLTLIGTKTKTETIKVPDTEEFRPKITDISIWENSESGVPQSWGAYIQNKSKLSYEVEAAGAYSSTIKSYNVVVNGTTYNKEAYTTDVLLTKGTNTIVVTITDSRGRKATLSDTFEVIEYSGPIITNFSTNRCLEDGSLDDEGEFVKIEIDAIVPMLNDKNTYSYYLKYKKEDDNEFTDYEFNIDQASDDKNFILSKSIVIAADGDFAFDYMLLLADTLTPGGVNKLADIESVFQLINFHESGSGMSIGKIAEKPNALEVAMPIYDRFEQLISNGLAEYGDGKIDANTTLSHLCLAQYNTPNNSFYFVMTFFYGRKSLETNRTQIAIPYIYNIGQNKRNIYIRQYVDGAWNEWTDIDESKSYSTNEVVVGTWVDGKPLYRKYFTSMLFTQSQPNWQNAIDISSYNIETIVDSTFYSVGNQNQGLTPQKALLTQINGNYLQVYSETTFQGFKTCLLDYTKTTD